MVSTYFQISDFSDPDTWHLHHLCGSFADADTVGAVIYSDAP
jgi:hypothetical protein